MRTRLATLPWVCWAALALIAAQLAVRAVVAFGGFFYWDDLILIGRAGTHDLLSPSYLFDDHDGHVMPGAFLLAGVLSRLWPLQWAAPAVSLVVLQLLASLALLRALRVILGWRPVLLVPLVFALFCTLGLPAFAWWAAALNSLPMCAALAWVCADAILLARTGNRRYALTGTLAYAGGLLFFEKAAVIPFVAFTAAALLRHVSGATVPDALAQAWRAGARLWTASLAVTGGWIAVYLAVVDQQRWSLDPDMTRALLWRSVTHGIVPSLAGGPWTWARWAPASPWALPGAAVMTLGWLVLAGLLAVSLARKRRLLPVWLAAAGYAAACQVPIYLMRSSAFTALELAQTLRYLADLVVVLAILGAVGLCAPNRDSSRWLDAAPWRTAVVGCLAVAFTASSLYSTATFLARWRDDPARPYLHNALPALAAARAQSDAPLLDQEVDPLVLQRVVHPENLAGHLFALVRDRPEFDSATTRLRMLTSAGTLTDAQVTWVRSIIAGPVPQCGYLVQPELPVTLGLDGPLLPADWTAEINYLANVDGAITLSLSDGPDVRVRVRPGLNRVFVRLPGSGHNLTARADTAALSVCIAAGPLGYVAPK
ncbi:hypothetical protein [Mycolicibacter senuensis]|uniref:Transmembrane protein n=1 Tax=Mycolicibacter senuensis TaxID=386913 RepID=A0A7I9XM83_9MYCO|nr:hypothetical protein [Mycolicibacter senuensis]ORW66402.1 hypothetical protein AWC24_15450 [Mycolicibacter senuensis]GFG71034.1 hypothetical protein MSEN_27540 [Mycolicibacter senuensis]